MKRPIIFAIILLAAGAAAYAFWISKTQPPTATSPISPSATASPSAKIATSMILTSPSFENGAPVPAKFTCDGGDINPEFQIQYVPAETKSLALIVDDPDAVGGLFTHWTLWNINPQTALIKQESVPPGAIEGKTSFGSAAYGGPCPPPGKVHHYHFTLYALDSILNLPAGAPRADLEKAMQGHILATAELVGTHER